MQQLELAIKLAAAKSDWRGFEFPGLEVHDTEMVAAAQLLAGACHCQAIVHLRPPLLLVHSLSAITRVAQESGRGLMSTCRRGFSLCLRPLA